MSETYEPGELFVYTNGDHWELGEVKSANNTGTGYFCWYSTGDTAANTPTRCMHKLANAGWSHIERRECMDAGRYCFICSECGWVADEPHHAFGGFRPNYCPNCGRKVKR